MSKVILTRDHRGLGKRGEVYDCPNDEVADKLIRLGRAVVSETDLPCAEPVPEPSDEPAASDSSDVTSFDDLQSAEDDALLSSSTDDGEGDD